MRRGRCSDVGNRVNLSEPGKPGTNDRVFPYLSDIVRMQERLRKGSANP